MEDERFGQLSLNIHNEESHTCPTRIDYIWEQVKIELPTKAEYHYLSPSKTWKAMREHTKLASVLMRQGYLVFLAGPGCSPHWQWLYMTLCCTVRTELLLYFSLEPCISLHLQKGSSGTSKPLLLDDVLLHKPANSTAWDIISKGNFCLQYVNGSKGGAVIQILYHERHHRDKSCQAEDVKAISSVKYSQVFRCWICTSTSYRSPQFNRCLHT